MIFAALLGLLLLPALFMIGAPFLNLFDGGVDVMNFWFSAAIGLGVLLWSAGLTVRLGFPSAFGWIPAIVLALAIYLVCILKRLKSPPLLVRHIWNDLAVPTFVGFAFLCAGGAPLAPQLRLRVGPDAIGWLSSAQWLASGGTLSSLQERVRGYGSQFVHPDAFLASSRGTLSSIIAIPDYALQVKSEFLLGAHRTALPAALSWGLRLEHNPSHIPVVWYAMFFVAAALTTGLLMGLLRHNRVALAPAVIIAVLAIVTPPVLAPAFEGGGGQLIMLPLYTAMVVALLMRSAALGGGAFFAAAMAAPATTLDPLLLGLPVLFLVLVAIGFKAPRSEYRRVLRAVVMGGVSGAALNVLEFPQVIASVSYRLGDYDIAGWPVPFSPLPGDLIGWVAWLPDRGLGAMVTRPALGIVLNSILCVVLFVAFKRYATVGRFGELAYLSGVLLILLLGWLVVPSGNNYVLWKLGLTFTPILFTLAMVPFAGQSLKPLRNFKRTNHTGWDVFSTLVLSAGLSTLIWVFGWHQNSSPAAVLLLDRQQFAQVNDLLRTHSVEFKTGDLYLSQFALFDALVWPARQQPVLQVSRPAVFIVPPNLCAESNAALFRSDSFCVVRPPE